MSKASTLLLYYCTIISLFLSVSGIVAAQSSDSLIFQAIFLPVTVYFLISIFRNLKSHTLDVNLSGRTTVLTIFILIFAVLLFFAVKNIQAKAGTNNEQENSSQAPVSTEESEKDTPLIYTQKEAK
jgi:hypothetical protein